VGWRDAVGGTAKVPEGGEKGGRQRERISARARTPSGDTTKVPLRWLKPLRQGQNSPLAQTADPAAITPSPGT